MAINAVKSQIYGQMDGYTNGKTKTGCLAWVGLSWLAFVIVRQKAFCLSERTIATTIVSYPWTQCFKYKTTYHVSYIRTMIVFLLSLNQRFTTTYLHIQLLRLLIVMFKTIIYIYVEFFSTCCVRLSVDDAFFFYCLLHIKCQ